MTASRCISLAMMAATVTVSTGQLTRSALDAFSCSQVVSSAPLVVIHYSQGIDINSIELGIETSLAGYAAVGVGYNMLGPSLLGFIDITGMPSTHAILIPTDRTVEAVQAVRLDPNSDAAVFVEPNTATVTQHGGTTLVAYTYTITVRSVIVSDGLLADLIYPIIWAADSANLFDLHEVQGQVDLDFRLCPHIPDPAPPLPFVAGVGGGGAFMAEEGLSDGVIAAIVIGVIFAVLFLALLLTSACCKRKMEKFRGKSRKELDASPPASPSVGFHVPNGQEITQSPIDAAFGKAEPEVANAHV